jgi:hypothetical protein
MLGIIWDVAKFTHDLHLHFVDEIDYLRATLAMKDKRIEELEILVFKHFGLIPRDATASQESRDTASTQKARSWRGQKEILEKKFSLRPPELVDRERQWQKVAEEQSKMLVEEPVLSGYQEEQENAG